MKKISLICFFDPPYKDNTYLKVISLIKKKNYSKNHKIIIRREKDSKENLDKI